MLAERISRQGVSAVSVGQVIVADRQLTSVPADGKTTGEILVRSNTVMAGYLDDDGASTEAFRGGWFHTGDLGVMHPDGYNELTDRSKDVIISGGENSPRSRWKSPGRSPGRSGGRGRGGA